MDFKLLVHRDLLRCFDSITGSTDDKAPLADDRSSTTRRFPEFRKRGTEAVMSKRITPEMDLIDQSVIQHIEQFGAAATTVGH
jgi:hypothetical protein